MTRFKKKDIGPHTQNSTEQLRKKHINANNLIGHNKQILYKIFIPRRKMDKEPKT